MSCLDGLRRNGATPFCVKIIMDTTLIGPRNMIAAFTRAQARRKGNKAKPSKHNESVAKALSRKMGNVIHLQKRSRTRYSISAPVSSAPHRWCKEPMLALPPSSRWTFLVPSGVVIPFFVHAPFPELLFAAAKPIIRTGFRMKHRARGSIENRWVITI